MIEEEEPIFLLFSHSKKKQKRKSSHKNWVNCRPKLKVTSTTKKNNNKIRWRWTRNGEFEQHRSLLLRRREWKRTPMIKNRRRIPSKKRSKYPPTSHLQVSLSIISWRTRSGQRILFIHMIYNTLPCASIVSLLCMSRNKCQSSIFNQAPAHYEIPNSS